MLFYADHSHMIDLSTTAWRLYSNLTAIAEHYRRNTTHPYRVALQTHAGLVAAVIALGEAHQALADQLCPDLDDVRPETEQMAAAGLLLGRCLFRSVGLLQLGRDNSIPDLVELLDSAALAVSRTPNLAGGGPLLAKVTEGYAFYSLYPEMYLNSLSRALAINPGCNSYVVIGIRSIGTSLAAVVAGALIEKGYMATAITLRPRGNPFDRYIELSPELIARLRGSSRAGSGFIVVDEGPGLTCSSFLSVSTTLEKMGVEQERISLLSAWQGKPSLYASEELRERWKRSRVFHTPAEEAFGGWRAFVPFILHSVKRSKGENGHSTLPEVEIADLSYGRWRERCYPTPDRWPVVHQAMERTKLLVHLPGVISHLTIGVGEDRSPLPMGEGQGEGVFVRCPSQPSPRPSPTAVGEGVDCLLAKFAGLGDYGLQKYERASILANAGFGPPVAGLAYGFLLFPFLEDFRPMSTRELTPDVMVRLVNYYAYILQRFSKPPMDRFDSLIEMLEVNAGEGLKLDLSDYARRWRPFKAEIDQLPLVLLDAKPQPYEWLLGTAGGQSTLLKADNADHFRDHSIVGEQSILWDLAGACEEWEMDEGQVDQFLSFWERKTGEHKTANLLDFFRAAYLALRVAAVHYAIHGTGEENTRASLQQQQLKYSLRLQQLIGRQLGAES